MVLIENSRFEGCMPFLQSVETGIQAHGLGTSVFNRVAASGHRNGRGKAP
jgi:hypothetical protein